MAGHVILLGDSIFDNAAYTRGEPDVVAQLRRLLPEDWKATLCAVDGATTRSFDSQLSCVPADATHIVVSIGGNDALQNTDLLSLRTTSAVQVLEAFASRITAFEERYRRAISSVLALQRRTILCTIYDGALDAGIAAAARVGLALFNDVILRTAVELNVPALELRSVCTLPRDYTNEIEPSGQGGLKIARAIAQVLRP